jgi:hypothetical protein
METLRDLGRLKMAYRAVKGRERGLRGMVSNSNFL